MDNLETADNKNEANVFSEILRTPVIKEMLRDYLNSIDPEKGRSRVKVLLWEDPEIVMAFLAALPSMINWTAAALGEMGAQFSNFTPQLLYGFLKQVSKDIDKDRINYALGAYGSMIKDLYEKNPEFAAGIQNTLKGPVAAAVGKGIDSSVRFINRAQEDNPNFLAEIVSGITSNIDNKEFKKASLSITNAVLDKVSFIKIIFRLAISRIKHKFRRKKRRTP